MRQPRAFMFAVMLLGVVGVVALTGCSSTSGSTTAGNATATATTAVGAATATGSAGGSNSNPQSCQQVPGFSQAGPIPEGGRLSNVPFPSGSQANQLVDTVNSTGLYEVVEFGVCSPSTSVTAVHSYFAGQFPSMGWQQSGTYPYDGGYLASCGDPYCWKVGAQPEFSSLEKVTDAGNGFVTYNMRLAFPPTLPDCSNIVPDGSPTRWFFWEQQPTVPLPPLTAEGLGDGYGTGGKTVYSQAECSAGTAASVNAFLSSEMSKHGWSATGQNLCGSTGWVINSAGLALKWVVTDPTNWTMNYCK